LIFATDKPEATIEKVGVALPDLQDQDQKKQEEKKKKSEKKDVKAPKLIKKVDPVYPEEARKAGIEGTVTVEATTDDRGHVQKVKVLSSIPELDQAAVDAVKQWVYEPMMIDGKPRGIVFTITCRFSLDKEKKATAIEGGVTGTDQKPAVRAVGDIKPPKLIKLIKPVYPDEARKEEVEGVVIVEAITDIYGRVVNTTVLRSIPGLDQAAVDAVKQWVYEPMVIDGKPRGIVFTITCRFSLDNERMGKAFEGGVTGEDQKPAVRAVGDIKPPKLIKSVKPVYPELARKAVIEGVVILEATTDVYGRVVDTKILRSIPLLDQAAIDAVEQWIYEPMIIAGEPRGIMFTVTCTFKLEEPVRAVDDIKPPKLIKKVEPFYPESARKAGIEGTVILEATTDIYGKVKKVEILRSIPELDKAAMDAVKQWVYEPKIIEGKPRGVIFTVTVVFKLK
jgi:TonB family protein